MTSRNSTEYVISEELHSGRAVAAQIAPLLVSAVDPWFIVATPSSRAEASMAISRSITSINPSGEPKLLITASNSSDQMLSFDICRNEKT